MKNHPLASKSIQKDESELSESQKQRSYLDLVRDLPERQRKIILWLGVIIIGILLFTFYIQNLKLRLKSLRIEGIKEELKIPEFQEKLKEMPKIEMPKIEIPEISEEEWEEMKEGLSEEEFKILEEKLKEIQK